MKISSGLGVVGGLMIAGSVTAQHSVWLPPTNSLVVTPSYLFQTFDHFWLGKQKARLGGDLRQHLAYLAFDYGLAENTALDATVGWEWSQTDGVFGKQNDDGLTDTTFGIRERLLDEIDFNRWWIPSLGVRVGGIIKGNYDENFPFSAGNGASGAEFSLLGGKSIWPGLGFYGDVGYRYQDGHAPDEWFGSSGLFVSWKFMSATVGYRFTQGLSGPDIGDPGFTFSNVKEISQTVEASIGFTDPGGRYYRIFVGHTFRGQNAGERDIVGGAISFTF